MISMTELAHDLEALTPIPVSIPRLARVVAEPHSSVANIVAVIKFDPPLAATTLRLANSAFYAFAEPTTTVQEAVRRLGAGRVLHYVTGRYAKDLLARSCDGYDLAERELWQHSAAAALAVDSLRYFTAAPIPACAFTAALLHDIGKLILSRYLEPDLKAMIRELAASRALPYVDAERVVLGCDHAQVGGVVARHWRFPDVLADCIQWHHSPRPDGANRLAMDAVHVANAVAKSVGIGIGSEAMNLRAAAASAHTLGLTPQRLEALCAAVADQLPSIIQFFEEV